MSANNILSEMHVKHNVVFHFYIPSEFTYKMDVYLNFVFGTRPTAKFEFYWRFKSGVPFLPLLSREFFLTHKLFFFYLERGNKDKCKAI